ncbi:MAG TPA: hypothetical protein VF172_12615 [Nitrososphaera sp.]|jgi:hypothetical protein
MCPEGMLKHGISEPEEVVPFENVCTCKGCKHDLARDCAKSGCMCCKRQDHSMVMDGIEGFLPTDKEVKKSYGGQHA